jgi:hypothetical protein
MTFAVVPYSQMRYPSCGDWLATPEGLRIIAADTGSWRYNALVLLHEAVEALLCRWHGVTQAAVDKFDMVDWPRIRGIGWSVGITPACRAALNDNDPGAWPSAPYHSMHMTATRVERLAALALFVRWNKYEAALHALADTKEQAHG